MSLTKDQLFQFLANHLGIDTADIAEDTPLFSSGVIDSGSMVDLIVHIEASSGIAFTPDDISLDNLDSISQILRFVAERAQ